jgi:hypothetical protein
MASYPKHILWTGGWDSSFRVISAARSGLTLQPHYIIDTERGSTGAELHACDEIRRALPADVAARILPSICSQRGAIPAVPEISAAFNRLRTRWWMGDQYDWISRYCQTHQLVDMELCIHADDKAHSAVRDVVHGARIDATKESDQYAVFGCFEFPVFDLTKRDMLRAAEKDGFLDVLNLSWFCHNPWNGKPCGVCNPCAYTIEEGLAHRVPFAGRIRHKIRPLARRWRKLVGV